MKRRGKVEAGRFSIDPHKGNVIKMMQEFAHRHDSYTVFSDFVEMGALAISNRIDKRHYVAREARYMDIVGKYTKEEANRFAAMFGELQQCYQARIERIGRPGGVQGPGEGLGDVLGQLFMALNLGNDRAGQFFTPYEVSLLMAIMTVGDGAHIRKQGFIKMNEPACGSAGMVVATAQAIHQAGLNYPEVMHATCIDIDARCVHMAYVQLSLLGIPAYVIHGNALSMETWGDWITPAHFIVGWDWKLRRPKEEAVAELLRDAA